MRPVGIAVIVLFLLVAGIIISNTIRLTVFARRREISIMQLVGATNTYIRMPFICEGLLAGLAGTAIAVGALALARASLMPKVATALPWLPLHSVGVDVTMKPPRIPCHSQRRSLRPCAVERDRLDIA